MLDKVNNTNIAANICEHCSRLWVSIYRVIRNVSEVILPRKLKDSSRFQWVFFQLFIRRRFAYSENSIFFEILHYWHFLLFYKQTLFERFRFQKCEKLCVEARYYIISWYVKSYWQEKPWYNTSEEMKFLFHSLKIDWACFMFPPPLVYLLNMGVSLCIFPYDWKVTLHFRIFFRIYLPFILWLISYFKGILFVYWQNHFM